MRKEEIFISDSFEIFLKYLYGYRNYHQYSGLKSKSEWKKNLLKIINSIESSIKNTIEIIDNEHRINLLTSCSYTKKQITNAKNINEINEKAILGLFKLVFFLIGDRPENMELNRVNNSKHWKLNSHRQISYQQSYKQKFDQIIDNAPHIDNHNEDKYNSSFLLNKFNTEFNRDYFRFLEWFKEEYREIYHELF